MRTHRASVAALVVALLLLPGCSSAGVPAPRTAAEVIRFAAYDFSENQILVAVYAEAARRAGMPVTVQTGVATREVLEPALEQGVVDVVIDYLGTAVSFVGRTAVAPAKGPVQLHAQLSQLLAGRGVSVLDAARAQDQNGFAVTIAFAAAHRIDRLSQLGALASHLTFGGPAECPDRPFCLPGLRSAYGATFRAVRSMPSRSATVEALLSGQIDVGMLETTDARLSLESVLLLQDDRALQPNENVVPLVGSTAITRWGPGLRTALDAVSARLTTADLVRLNKTVEVDGHTPAEAAAQWWSGY
ncbi:MAG: osmoprotectant transport system substrate-binding protein [Blastococcus sp.]|jgi:osmoprotectant transport system substrate-binding protein|nr:osmoprotectant transport system substrate-binding protein [Blastococcus sp.]